MPRMFSVIAVVLTAGTAWAGTMVKSGISPIPDYCRSSFCAYHASTSCTANTDCSFGSVSPKSGFSMSGSGGVKIQVKDVLNSAGMPATGEYLLKADIYDPLAVDPTHVTLKVPVVNGKGSSTADVSAYLASPGSPTVISIGSLAVPLATPGDCPGTNSPADIQVRIGNANCNSTNDIAVIGTTTGSTNSLKGNLAPVSDICSSSHCYVNGNFCNDDSNCSFGSVSAKSKVSVRGDGSLKMQLKGVVDASGMPVTGDYLLRLQILGLTTDNYQLGESVYVKVTAADGKGKAAADLSTVLGSAGTAAIYNLGEVRTDTSTPGECPGDNSAAGVASRLNDSDCNVGRTIAFLGVVAPEP